MRSFGPTGEDAAAPRDPARDPEVESYLAAARPVDGRIESFPRLARKVPHGRVAGLDVVRGVMILYLWAAFRAGHVMPAGAREMLLVLSGYLTTHSLLSAKNSRRFFVTFFARRAFRIVPVCAVTLGLLLLLRPEVSRDWYWYAFFLSNFKEAAGASAPPESAGFWFLSVTAQYYLVWPVVVRLLPADSLRSWAWGMMLVGPAVRAAVGGTTGLYLLPGCADSLGAGALAALSVRETPPVPRPPAGLRSLIRQGGGAPIVVAALLYAAAAAAPRSGALRPDVVFGPAALTLGSAAILLMATTPYSAGAVPPAGAAPLQMLGRFALPLSLFYPLVERSALLSRAPLNLFTTVVVTAVITCAWTVFVEHPLGRLRDARFGYRVWRRHATGEVAAGRPRRRAAGYDGWTAAAPPGSRA